MALFAISDIHLSLGTDKPMDIFKNNWEGYVEKLKNNWVEIIKEEDTVIVPGDISWATYLEETKEDFSFLDSLPGKKIISKGNHDYWWNTVTKMNAFLKENNFNSIYFLHNNFYTCEDWDICGTKGWAYCEKETADENEKIFNREQKRLENSLRQSKNNGNNKIIAVFHYPPFYAAEDRYDFIETMKRYNVSICLYGHIHGDFSQIFEGMIDGIEFKFVSADYLDFKPKRIMWYP